MSGAVASFFIRAIPLTILEFLNHQNAPSSDDGPHRAIGFRFSHPMNKDEAAQAQIVHDFVLRFNRAAPDFPLMFKGTLEKAICACWPKNAKLEDRRRMLALFVQKGFGEAFVNYVNCMSSPRMKMILMESFVVWGWDVEDPERFTELEALVLEKLDDAGKEIAPELKNNPFPKFYLIDKSHGVITLAHKITEFPSEDQMFLEVEAAIRPMIRGSVDKLAPMDFREKRKSSSVLKDTLGDRIEGLTRTIPTHVCEAAIHPTGLTFIGDHLRADNHVAAIVIGKSVIQRRASMIAEHQRERRLLSARMSVLGVPPEPLPNDRGVIVFRFTDQNTSHERRFSEDDTVDGVVNYLISIGYSPEFYRFMGKKSRTDFGKVNRDLRLKALQIGRNEIITIESQRNKSKDYTG